MELIIKQLQDNGIEFEKGLSIEEVDKIEQIYGIHFPKELKDLYMASLPVSYGFYKWRDFSAQNINYINKLLQVPFNSIIHDTEDVEWSDTWGEEPSDSDEREEIIKEKVKIAPKLIPVYSHRYIISTEQEQSPVFSIHGTDIICYGENLQKYLEIEFLGKSYNEIEFDKIKTIPFWSEII